MRVVIYEMELTEKQRRFVDAYIISGTAYKAALEAGYSKSYAKTNSHKLLENTRIRDEIERRTETIRTSKIADQTEIMEFLTSVVRGEVEEPTTKSISHGVQEIAYVKPNVNTRRQAAVDLGKRYAMWTDKHDMNITVPQFVEDVPEDD